MGQSSGVGVVDKTVALLDAAAQGPASLMDLMARTALPRATVHRLAVALELHQLLGRDQAGKWRPGPALGRLAAGLEDALLVAAARVLAALREETGESAQLYRSDGAVRVCVAAAERASGLRDTVPVGARLPLTAGSAAQVFAAWGGAGALPEPPPDAVFTLRTLRAVRRRGWAISIGQREAGVSSVSAPVFGGDGRLTAVVSVSGPTDRLGRGAGARLSPPVVRAATALSAAA